jgi:hypothetical protein
VGASFIFSRNKTERNIEQGTCLPTGRQGVEDVEVIQPGCYNPGAGMIFCSLLSFSAIQLIRIAV